MRQFLWKCSLGLLLSTLTGLTAQGEELLWRAGETPTPAAAPKVVLGTPRVQLGAPIPAGPYVKGPVRQPTGSTVPSVTIDQPYGSHRVVRAQLGDMPQPLPNPQRVISPLISESRGQGSQFAQQVPNPLPGGGQMNTTPGYPQFMPQIPHSGMNGQPQPLPLATGLNHGPIVSQPISGGCVDGSCGGALESPLYGGSYYDNAAYGYGDAGDGFSPGRWYADTQYLLWWTKGSQAPTLLTTGLPVDGGFGVLGGIGTQTLLGDRSLLQSRRDGALFRLGYWFDDCHTTGIESSFFFLGEARDKFNYASNGMTVLSRPFFDPGLGFGRSNTAEVIANPGVTSGRASVEASSNFWGGDINLRRKLYGDCNVRVDGLAGFRFLSLSDKITINETVVGIPGGPVDGFLGTVTDSFSTSNQFYGGQVGLSTRWTEGRWSVDLLTKIGIGSTQSVVEINGGQTVLAQGNTVIPPGQYTGGLLALNSNIGRYSQERFSVVPEIGLNVGYQWTEHIRLVAGYNFIYWSSVMRAADQIDTVVDGNRIPNFNGVPGTLPPRFNRPVPLMKNTDYWATGATVGLHFTW